MTGPHIPPNPGGVSIYDVAKVAGVNPSTVSRALNNRDRIGDATRKRIRRIAQELGYQPSAIARSLATQRTQTIGVVVPALSDVVLGKTVGGIEQRAGEAGYSVLFSTSRRDRHRELIIAQDFQRRRVDSVIIVTTHLRRTYELFQKTLTVPIVVVGQEDRMKDVAVVTIDDNAAAAIAVQHLIDLGHRDLAYVGVEDRPYSNANRRDGIEEALLSGHPGAAFHAFVESAESDLTRGQNAFLAVSKCGATAVLCYNDMIAIGLISAAKRHGLVIPDDLSVVGYDDIEIAAHLSKPLTTTRQPFEEMGRKSVEIALDLLNGGVKRHHYLTSQFFPRETTGNVRRNPRNRLRD